MKYSTLYTHLHPGSQASIQAPQGPLGLQENPRVKSCLQQNNHSSTLGEGLFWAKPCSFEFIETNL